MWRHWSAAVLKVICACFTPTGIYYLHRSSPEAPTTTGGVNGKSTSQSASITSISILHGSLTQEDVMSGLSSVPWKLHHHWQLWQGLKAGMFAFLKQGIPNSNTSRDTSLCLFLRVRGLMWGTDNIHSVRITVSWKSKALLFLFY